MLSRSRESSINKSIFASLALHSLIVIVVALLFYFQKPEPQEDIEFQVIEKFKVTETPKPPPPIQIEKPKPKPKSKTKKRQVYGLSRKSMTSKTGTANVKRGNTLNKTPDKKKLNKDDDDSLPIPADEFLISSMPKVLNEIRPIYPQAAKKKGLQGKVIFEILIDGQGTVRVANLIQSLDDDLDRAAKTAMMKFKFRPATIGEKPVAVKIKYAINFVLEK